MQRDALRDDQWTKIKDFLPGREGHGDGHCAAKGKATGPEVLCAKACARQRESRKVNSNVLSVEAAKLPACSNLTAEFARAERQCLQTTSPGL